jgi:hypothetical protein
MTYSGEESRSTSGPDVQRGDGAAGFAAPSREVKGEL